MILVEGGPRVLPAFPEDLSAQRRARSRRARRRSSHRTLRHGRGRWLRRDRCRTHHARHGLLGGGQRRVAARARRSARRAIAAGRVYVNDDLSVPGHPEVFVIGDLAVMSSRWQAGARCGARRHAERAHGGAEHLRTDARRAARPFRYRQQRRPWRPSDAIRPWRASRTASERKHCVVDVAVRPHHVPGGISEPAECAARVGVLVLHVPARVATHYRRRSALRRPLASNGNAAQSSSHVAGPPSDRQTVRRQPELARTRNFTRDASSPSPDGLDLASSGHRRAFASRRCSRPFRSRWRCSMAS